MTLKQAAKDGKRLADEAWEKYGAPVISNEGVYTTIEATVPIASRAAFHQAMYRHAWHHPGVIFRYEPHEDDEYDTGYGAGYVAGYVDGMQAEFEAAEIDE